MKNHHFYDDPIDITPRRDGLVGRVGNKKKSVCLVCVRLWVQTLTESYHRL